MAATPSQAGKLAAALPGLRALPALATLDFANVTYVTPRLAAAMAEALPAAAPRLKCIHWQQCAPAVSAACFSAAARLPVLDKLIHNTIVDLDSLYSDDSEDMLSADDCARIAASLSTPGAFQNLRVR